MNSYERRHWPKNENIEAKGDHHNASIYTQIFLGFCPVFLAFVGIKEHVAMNIVCTYVVSEKFNNHVHHDDNWALGEKERSMLGTWYFLKIAKK